LTPTLESRASRHAIDRYFMQLRRLFSMLERPGQCAAENAAH
jgi:hypothetical protein